MSGWMVAIGAFLAGIFVGVLATGVNVNVNDADTVQVHVCFGACHGE